MVGLWIIKYSTSFFYKLILQPKCKQPMFLILLTFFFYNLPSYLLYFIGGVCLPPEKLNICPSMLKARGVCSDTWSLVCMFELGLNWYWCRETYFWGHFISLYIIHTLHSIHPIAIIGVSATGDDLSEPLQQAGPAEFPQP